MPPYVMLLVSMQGVINAQYSFLLKMKQVINEEFDKREIGHSTFQVQKQVQDMLASFKANVITKLDVLSHEGSSSLTHKNDSSTPTNTVLDLPKQDDSPYSHVPMVPSG